MEQVQGYTPEEIEGYQRNVELGAMMDKLLKSKAFKELFMDMYLKDGSEFLVENMAIAKNRDMISEQFLARSWFKKHINDVISNAYASARALEDIQEQTLEDISND